ncbi:MAG TPA: amino acid ABC transporter permease [Alcaligenaceae bacterium]|uniref:amino acid ABC transporter permease n=1 Tax=Paenalcaligenes sp. TaxID=1966342 RepID=UPI0017559BE0|nr:amino acid ABC transporter permease [Paenalcaligenes sp.]HHU94278.1 amino acid ABC transporter permease [Alcaligenaceae bacterium]
MGLDFSVLSSYWPAIAKGFLMTIYTWLASVVLGMLLGFLIAILQRHGGLVIRSVLRVYIEIIRTTPFLVQLFVLYYGGPTIGLDLSPTQAGVLSLTVYGSVYFAEVFRGGFAAVPKGQTEAAEFLGLSRFNVIWRVNVPQMLVIITPSLVNLIIILSKETAILSIVTVPELTAVMVQIGNEQFAHLETTLVLCVAYLILVAATERVGRWAEARSNHFLAR